MGKVRSCLVLCNPLSTLPTQLLIVESPSPAPEQTGFSLGKQARPACHGCNNATGADSSQAKPAKHTAAELKRKEHEALTNMGGGKAGMQDRMGGDKGHAKFAVSCSNSRKAGKEPAACEGER